MKTHDLRPEPAKPGIRPAPGRPRQLSVGGVEPFTATDYPGQIAAVVFVQGCAWRCGYCHNPHLQPRTRHGAIQWDDLVALLERRVGLIDAVVFSGGEPTTDPALADAMEHVRTMGFKIGLHSGGIHPRRLGQVLPRTDWVGLDVKAPFENYERITRVRGSGHQARDSLEAVLDSGVDYECRTTLHPSLLPAADILSLARTLAGMKVKRYALQLFRSQGCNDNGLNAAAMAGYPGERLIREVSALFPDFTLRRG